MGSALCFWLLCAGNAGAQKLPAPVTAIAFSPEGKTLAVGGYRVVRLIDPTTGAVTRALTSPTDQVQALAWSSDGKWLAAAGGIPGSAGEVVIFDMTTGKPARALAGHTEVVYAVAWKPNASELATGSLDKTARIWDAATGQIKRVIKDHADAIFGIAYAPDGSLLATGSADRTAKLFDTTTWKPLAVLNAHQDTVTRVAFRRDGALLATVGADKTARIWKVKRNGMENPERVLHEGDGILACAFSPDGNYFVWGASNRTVRIFHGDGAQQQRELKEPQDWVYTVAISADNQTLAAGTQDGKVLLWNMKEGKLLRVVAMPPR
jgi:WD40 repeat protein